MSTPYTLGTHYGVPMDNLTLAAFEAGLAKVPASIRARIRVTQGAPSGATASAGTHAGRGANDIIISGGTWQEYRIVENAFRSVGFAFWYRAYLPGVWPAHGHMVLVGHRYLARSAYQQTLSYRRGRNGLRGDGDDPNNRNPHVIYKYRSNDMALSKRDARAIAREVWRYEMSGDSGVKKESAGERLRRIRVSAMEANESVGRDRGSVRQSLEGIEDTLGGK